MGIMCRIFLIFDSMGKLVDIKKDDVFGYWTATGSFCKKKYSGHDKTLAECICVCGRKKLVLIANLNKGLSKSCGCKTRDIYSSTAIKNGRSVTGYDVNTDLYSIWSGIKDRCLNSRSKAYKNYGGRGIEVCDEWRDSFKEFYEWCLNNGWVKGLTLDRFPNNNGNYSPSNCRFATMREQQRNKRNNIIVEIFGEKKCLSEWAEDPRSVVSAINLRYRIRNGHSPEDSLTMTSVRDKYKVNEGDSFGYLTLTGEFKMVNGYKMVECKCRCGNVKFIQYKHIRSGRTKSCGCFKLKVINGQQ